jgi:hypothetical protein
MEIIYNREFLFAGLHGLWLRVAFISGFEFILYNPEFEILSEDYPPFCMDGPSSSGLMCKKMKHIKSLHSKNKA